MEAITAGNKRVLQVRRVRRGGFDKAKRKRFLDTLAATCNVTSAVRAAGVAQSSCYRARMRDAAFAAAWEEAIATGYQRLEEALLDYALARVVGEVPDPAAADPEALAQSPITALAERTISASDLHFAVGLLNRQRAAAEGKVTLGRRVKMASPAETDAALRRKLDQLARRMGPK
jgi:hypothetical protein